jgi:hypothetical protein
MLLGSAAMIWLSQLAPDSSYAGHLLPAMLVLGVGVGNVSAPAIASATHRVAPQDSGVASAMVNTMQQVSGSIGTALLSSIFAGAVASQLAGPNPQTAVAATMHGYSVAFWVAAGVYALGAAAVTALTPAPDPDPRRAGVSEASDGQRSIGAAADTPETFAVAELP